MTLGFGLVGFYDDYLKVTRQSHGGFAGMLRLADRGADRARRLLSRSRAWAGRPFATSLVFPFFKELVINLGWFFPIFGAFIIVGAGNAVNLTDGLDGLAIGPVMIAAASFVVIAYLVGNAVFADYLQIHFVAGTGELAVLCGAVIGAGLGFLWFNAPPASIFMGDTGSLALGGLIGSVAVATKHEIALAIIGGLFVLEAVSVIVQVVSFKLTGKRVFRMAPIHHHFEQLGWTESQIVIRFWIICDRAGARRVGHAQAAMIPVTSFAGKKVALFGLGGSGLASAQALVAGGADVDGLRRQRGERRKGARGRHSHRGSAPHRLVEDRRAAARARRAADPSGAALVGRAGAQRRRRGDRRHRTVLPRAAQARAAMRRSSPSPAPTANPPPRR